MGSFVTGYYIDLLLECLARNISIISVSVPPSKQDLSAQLCRTRCTPPGSVSAGAESTVKEAYSHPLLMRLCTHSGPLSGTMAQLCVALLSLLAATETCETLC